LAFGIFADGGDLGEASVKLHRDLGNEPVTQKNGVARANRGIEDSIITLVFPGRNVAGSVNVEAWNAAINQEGKDALNKWEESPDSRHVGNETEFAELRIPCSDLARHIGG
jgi:hypothetical protein